MNIIIPGEMHHCTLNSSRMAAAFALSGFELVTADFKCAQASFAFCKAEVIIGDIPTMQCIFL